MTLDAPPSRCFVHQLSVGPDGLCTLCRRARQPAGSGGGRVVFGGLVILSLLVGGAIVYRGGRGLLTMLGARESAEATPAGVTDGHVRLYTTAWCPHCKRAKQWLDAQHVAYEEIDLEASPGARLAHRKVSPRGSIPTLDANGEVVVGFDAGAYRAAIDRGARRTQ